MRIDATPIHSLAITRGRAFAERDDVPTLTAMRHSEAAAFIELVRAYADLADIAPSNSITVKSARDRITRRTADWTAASNAYFAALAASIEGEG